MRLRRGGIKGWPSESLCLSYTVPFDSTFKMFLSTKPSVKKCGNQGDTQPQGPALHTVEQYHLGQSISLLQGSVSLSAKQWAALATFFLAGLTSGSPRKERLGLWALPQNIVRISSLISRKSPLWRTPDKSVDGQETGHEQASRVCYALVLPQKSSTNDTPDPQPSRAALPHPLF